MEDETERVKLPKTVMVLAAIALWCLIIAMAAGAGWAIGGWIAQLKGL